MTRLKLYPWLLWLPAFSSGEERLDNLGQHLTRPVLGCWRTYTDPHVRTHLAPLPRPDDFLGGLLHGSKQSLADLCGPTRIRHRSPEWTSWVAFRALGGRVNTQATPVYVQKPVNAQIKRDTVMFSKSSLFLEDNRKNNNCNENKNNKTNIIKYKICCVEQEKRKKMYNTCRQLMRK